jgi:hypothetical protein
MGAWGLGIFENDDAGDWVSQLCRGNNLNLIFATFSEILEGDVYLELPESSAALAAAEVVAALRGNPTNDLPTLITTWISSHSLPVSDDLVETAKTVVNKIHSNSELKELIEDSGSINQWNVVVNDLISRLK